MRYRPVALPLLLLLLCASSGAPQTQKMAPAATVFPDKLLEGDANFNLVFLIQGDLRGNFGPGGGPPNSMGGFARRAAYWNAFANKFPGRTMIRLDGGSVFMVGAAEQAIVNRWMLEGTYRSGLDALNLTRWDLPAWQDLSGLADSGKVPRQFLDLPLVSANVRPRTAGFPNVRRFVVRETDAELAPGRKVRVGISGVLYDPEDRISRADFEVRNPEVAVREVLAEMQATTDYRVIMIDAGIGKAISLAALNPGISLLVVAHDYEELAEPQQVGETLISVAANEGRLCNEVRVHMKQDSGIAAAFARFVPLDRTIPDDQEMAGLIRRAQEEVDAFRRGR